MKKGRIELQGNLSLERKYKKAGSYSKPTFMPLSGRSILKGKGRRIK
jgi:hypothetical protein